MGNNWEEKKLTGNSAENIVQFLINSTQNWKCCKFGVENHIEELRKLVKKINPVTKKIKSMPDFVAYNEKTGETFFVEVKYRGFIDKKEGKLEIKLDFLNEYLEYWKETKLIIIHNYPPYFFVIDLKEVKQNMCRKKQVETNKWEYYWNFAEIQKDIKDIFPEIKEETMALAHKSIQNL